MATVSQSAHTLLDVINDVLDFSKIEAGMMELTMETIDLHILTNQAADAISFQAQKKNIDLIVTVGDHVPRFVLADTVRLRQVLVNLMGNAIKFTEQGEIELKIEVLGNQNLEIQTASYSFSVRDTGIGIHPDNQKKIFEAFAQEDSYTTKKFGGTGLGLSISNRLLALMGSHLQVQSEPGKGSTFYFDVTFNTVTDNSDDTNPSHTAQGKWGAGSSKVISASVIKILIAEDNAVNMTLIKIVLKKLLPKAMLVEAGNGKIAVELFDKERPNLVFMDVQMPELNGYDAAGEIRRVEKSWQSSLLSGSVGSADHRLPAANHHRIPIIALTAGTIKGEREKCLDAGMDDYMSKPIAIDALVAIINKWLPVFNKK